MRPRRPSTTILAILAVLALVATACWGDDDDEGQSGEPDQNGDVQAQATVQPLTIRLSQGEAAATVDPVDVVEGSPLDEARIAEILARLPGFGGADGDRTDFNRPAETLPPPLVGETVDQPFPALGDDAPPDVPSGPLEVLRFQPDGEVEIAPFFSVTFDQPMVPLGTLEQLDAEDVPVTMTPEPAGRWRWIGTRTLRFEVDPGEIDRLPMATDYRVEIPAGTESQTGGTLASDVTIAFATPAPTVREFAPQHDSLPLSPVFVATFDQRVDPVAVLDTITLREDGDERAVRLATDDEIAADDTARRIVDRTLDGRWVAFRAALAFRPDQRIEVEIGPGTPSAEGPRTTESAAGYDGRTYPPLEIAEANCGYGDGCRPESDFAIRFTNPLDTAAFDPATIGIDPELPGAAVGVFGDTLVVQGQKQQDTDYRVRIPAGLRDTFGQTLGDDEDRTFEVGETIERLIGFDRPLTTTDPLAESASVSVRAINHDELAVRLYAVTPDDWTAYTDYLQAQEDRRGDPPGRLTVDTTIEVDGEAGLVNEAIIDLTDGVDGGGGHVVVVVEPTESYDEDDERYWQNRPTATWAQVTTVGIDAVADDDELVVWATDLGDGSPLSGVTVELRPGDRSVTSDSDGLANASLGSGVSYLVASRGDETTILSPDYFGRWESYDRDDTARWYVIDDRALYRPGETVRLKGWVRRQALASDGSLSVIGPDATVGWTANDAQGAELGAGSAPVNAAGGFTFSLDLPEGANLGSAFVELALDGAGDLGREGFGHQFQIQEFRRPEFEVRTRAESAGPHLLTAGVTVAAEATYFAGGSLPDVPVVWTVRRSTAAYSPPGWRDFTFGKWVPWWLDDFGGGRGFVSEDAFFEGDVCCFPEQEQDVERFEGRTDGTGTHYLRMDFDGALPDEPISVSANGTVEDVNRQAFASTVDLLVHSGERYVGLRSSRTFVRQGEDLDIEVVLTDIDGEAVAGQAITVVAERLEWQFAEGEWQEVAVDPQECAVTSTAEPVECTFATDQGGQYRISSTVTDPDGGQNRTELTRWVSGGGAVPVRGVQQEQVTIVPDAEEHTGQSAELLVQAPFETGHGLLTVARNGIVSTETFELDTGTAVITIPITDADVPGLDVQIDVAGQAPRTLDDGTEVEGLPPRPAFATGRIRLAVPPVTRALTVEAVPRDAAVTPGDSTAVDITVTDATGNPVEGAELAVIVVDEAVLSLTGYELPDPLDTFYSPLYAELRTEYLRRTLVLSRPDDLLVEAGAQRSAATTTAVAAPTAGSIGGDDSADSAEEATADFDGDGDALAGGDGSATTPIDVRTNFDALALFAPEVPTDGDGRASVDVDLPDNLTRYRVMAVAVSGDDRFGSGESTITARLPLQVRPSAPRFLNFGDTFEFPVVVQNQTDEPMTVDVVLETANLATTAGAGRQVQVPADDRVEVRFPAAADQVGTARFRVTGVSGDDADSAQGELPVYTPATAEAFATYGVVDSGAVAQPMLTPEGVFPQFGGLEVNTSSTALQALTDAVIYLAEYRYETADAHASRILAIAALRDVLEAFDAAELPPPAELEAAVREDIDGLVDLQTGDGGFSYWTREFRSDPFTSLQATHALVAARAEGYSVPAETLQRALDYLRSIEDRIPSDWGRQTRATLAAYALHVRDLAGDRDAATALSTYREYEDVLALDGLAWLWPVIDDAGIVAEIERTFANRVTETPSAATFTTGYEEDAYLLLASDRRTDGIVLDALIRVRPGSDLIPKVVQGLIGNQVKGRWNNVQENAFILLALDRYFDTFEAQTPDFVARVWLGDLYAAEHVYEGRSIDRNLTVVPMSELVSRDDPDLVVSKDGAGRLYYRLGLRYAPDDLDLDPRDEGFVVDRTYAAVEDPADVVRNADGTWTIRAGAEVRVTVTMVADSRRTNMALIDPLPAGFEAVNPALAASPDVPPEEERFEDDGDSIGIGGDYFWPPWWQWYGHQNLRDDRVEAFSRFLPAGTYEYSYVARATTPGTFVVPPARAEEIYAPEVFGRSGSETVTVG